MTPNEPRVTLPEIQIAMRILNSLLREAVNAGRPERASVLLSAWNLLFLLTMDYSE